MAVAIVVFQALLACTVLCEAQTMSPERRLFESFLSNYSKGYKDDLNTMNEKFTIFQQSLERQKRLNEYEKEHGGTAVYGINLFSDLTPKEFEEMYLSPPRRTRQDHSNFQKVQTKNTTRKKFDWRDQGVIGPIRNQYQCGSCWAFAVVETMESAYAIEQNQSLHFVLSSQQLISCNKLPNLGLDGCKGGVLSHAFESLRSTQMVVVEESVYPFQSKDGEDGTCKPNLPNRGLSLSDFQYFDNSPLEQTMGLLQISPLATSVNAIPWQDYSGGIVQHHCTDKTVDHAVQVVGYDLTGEVPYWVVRNTWGSGWGEQGYIRLLHGVNMCGIRDEVAAVTKVKGVAL